MIPHLPPPRAPSSPGIPAEVWAELRGIAAKMTSFEIELATVKQTLAQMGANARSETIKVLATSAVSIVLAVVGSRAVAPQPEPTRTVIQTSAYDRALEACKLMQDDTARSACIVRVSADAAGPKPR